MSLRCRGYACGEASESVRLCDYGKNWENFEEMGAPLLHFFLFCFWRMSSDVGHGNWEFKCGNEAFSTCMQV